MSTPSRRRLLKDFKRLQDDAPEGISACPNEDNIMQWHAVIFGPDDTPWEGGTFKLSMEFSEEYPNKPPVAGAGAPNVDPPPKPAVAGAAPPPPRLPC